MRFYLFDAGPVQPLISDLTRSGFSLKNSLTASLLTLLLIPLLGCTDEPRTDKLTAEEQYSATESQPIEQPETAPRGKFALSLTGAKAHPKDAFTQGLFFANGHLYESSGLYGKSSLIKYNADVSSISVQRRLDDRYFAEGATLHKGKIYQLTWKAGEMLVYQGAMLTPFDQAGFNYEGEGWGLASDGEHLWISDGTDELRVMDSQGQVLRRVLATYRGQPLDRLNELEWVNGWLLANRWYDYHIYAINPNTGKAEGAFNLKQIAEPQLKKSNENVINGIAWNPDTAKLWITGKYWDRFYLADIELPDVTEYKAPE